MESPDTQYVDRDGKALAYQVVGNGPNIVGVNEIGAHLDLMWTDPGFVRLLSRWTPTVRMAMFERLGFGLSDPLSEVRPIEDQADDILAVMDAAGMATAVVAAGLTSAPGAVLAAARHPDRVTVLNLLCPLVQGWRSAPADELAGWTADALADFEARIGRMLEDWGTGLGLEILSPGMASPQNKRRFGLLERASASPGTVRALIDTAALIDVRHLLPQIQVPTVVTHVVDHPIPAEVFEHIVDLIPGARLRQAPAGRPDMDIAELLEPWFQSGAELAGIIRPQDIQRRLATVLFTDIVGSTELAGRLGDAEWRARLDRHDERVRATVAEGGGRVVKNLGDGAFSVFDGPAQAIRTAEQLLQALREVGLELRAGIHTGECEVRGDDLAGMAVHIGARVGAVARPAEILVSRTVHDLVVGSGIAFVSRGVHELKGVPGTWELLAVRSDASAPIAVDADEPRPLRPTDRMILAGARRAPGIMRRVNGMLARKR